MAKIKGKIRYVLSVKGADEHFLVVEGDGKGGGNHVSLPLFKSSKSIFSQAVFLLVNFPSLFSIPPPPTCGYPLDLVPYL